MAVTLDSEQKDSDLLKLIDHYCDILLEKDEICLITDPQSKLLKIQVHSSLQDIDPSSTDRFKTLSEIFPNSELLIEHAQGCMLRTQWAPSHIFCNAMNGRCRPTAPLEIQLYPVFASSQVEPLLNFTIRLNNAQEESVRSCNYHNPENLKHSWCIIDLSTGIYLDSNDSFAKILKRDQKEITSSLVQEIGGSDLLLQANMHADRRRCFLFQAPISGSDKHWVVSKNVELNGRHCLELHFLPILPNATENSSRAHMASQAIHQWQNRPENILICDDNDLLLDWCTELMDYARLPYQKAKNGKEALEWVERSPFDAILMDLNMPILNGFDTAKIIRAARRSYSNMPIIAMTATAFTTWEQEKQLQNFDALLQKPFDIQDIREAIDQGINNSQNRASSIGTDRTAPRIRSKPRRSAHVAA